ncbi:hypothetical protein BDN72DRAFT_878592 [Pluteus cervinus]|uniref:Uncharacterized protein n=1 Tax=Pluteus cervinus TaxID=181527 RepID=A0ACD3AU82_9AGAR|nr:hypothetical protein BDN72DRAFT_878592 [Pluteus cervinus]
MPKCTGCKGFYFNLTTHTKRCQELKIRSDTALRIYHKVEANPTLREQRDKALGVGEGSSFRRSRELTSFLKRKRDGTNGDSNNVAGPGTSPPETIAPAIGERPASPPTTPEPTEQLPAKRRRRLTEKVRAMLGDIVPEGPGPIFEYVNADSDQEEPDEALPEESVFIRIRRRFRTLANSFSLTRTYHGLPTSIPDKDVEFTYLLSDNLHAQAVPIPRKQRPMVYRTIAEIIAPYPSISAFILNRWFWRTGKKTKCDRDDLLEVMFDKRFSLEDIRGVDFDRLDQKVVDHFNHQDESTSKHPDHEEERARASMGWKQSAVRIDVPTGQKVSKANKKRKAAERKRRAKEDEVSSEDEGTSHKYYVPDFYHRSLVDLITEVCSGSTSSSTFHWHPYKENWQPPWEDATVENVYGELYSSPAFIEAHHLLQESPREPGCDLPRVIIPIIFYSDATHLTQFGQAKLSPVYVFFGNQSKYERGFRAQRAAHTLAFLPNTPVGLAEFIFNSTGRNPTSALLSHCRRELYHACWRKVFDDAFMTACEHGIAMDCGDRIRRRSYPRIFLDSMDYMEKIMAISIRDMGLAACPRCLILKEHFFQAGEPSDMEARRSLTRKDDSDYQKTMADARKLIYQKGYVVNSKRVEKLLSKHSLVPTLSAFSHPRLRACGLEMFDLMAIDLMHEVELGVWRSLLEHLIRILHCQGAAVVQEFNSRFRQVAPFGSSAIRKFTYNVSELRKLAARDYEDILQCCIPCMEALLPQDENETILDLLYLMMYFHSLAKLRMHTDSSIAVLKQVITYLCDSLRYFANETCKRFKTYETEREYNARRRKGKGKGVDGRKPKVFSLATSKFHALPDYPDQITRFGTTDSYSTKPDFYQRTNRNNAIPQIIKIDDLSSIHQRMERELEALEAAQVSALEAAQDDRETARITKEDLVLPYQIASTNKKSPVFLPTLLEEHQNDPAFRDFLPRLKAFVLAQHQQIPFTGKSPEFTQKELSDVFIKNNVIYEHATASFNFTTYDVRREREGVNTNRRLQGDRIRCDVMLPAPEESSRNRFWYARVLGIFHLEVSISGVEGVQNVDFLWVRWFRTNPLHPYGPSTLRLEQVEFLPMDDPDAFGFLHPSLIIRPCHVIPAFTHGRRVDLSVPSRGHEGRGDWEKYYIMRFADRDLMMRYLGLGVGHHNPSEFPREDRVLRQVPSGPHYTILPDPVGTSSNEEVAKSRPGESKEVVNTRPAEIETVADTRPGENEETTNTGPGETGEVVNPRPGEMGEVVDTTPAEHEDSGASDDGEGEEADDESEEEMEEGNEVDEWLRTQVAGEDTIRADFYDF